MARNASTTDGLEPGTKPDSETIVTVDPGAAEINQPEAPAPEPEEAEGRPRMADLTGVRYNGGPMLDRKTLTMDDLVSIGAEPKTSDDLVWSRENDFTVPIDEVNASTVDALINLPGFSAV